MTCTQLLTTCIYLQSLDGFAGVFAATYHFWNTQEKYDTNSWLSTTKGDHSTLCPVLITWYAV